MLFLVSYVSKTTLVLLGLADFDIIMAFGKIVE
jgi:hypothetical protein